MYDVHRGSDARNPPKGKHKRSNDHREFGNGLSPMIRKGTDRNAGNVESSKPARITAVVIIKIQIFEGMESRSK